MPALPLEADIPQRPGDVGLGPILLKNSARPQLAERFESARLLWRIAVACWGACANQACAAKVPKQFFNSIRQKQTSTFLT
jgi:hypothetical protein